MLLLLLLLPLICFLLCGYVFPASPLIAPSSMFPQTAMQADATGVTYKSAIMAMRVRPVPWHYQRRCRTQLPLQLHAISCASA